MRTTKSPFDFAWKVACLEAATLFSDLNRRVSCKGECDGQFSMNCVAVKAFEDEESDDKSSFRFFDAAKCHRVSIMSLVIMFYGFVSHITGNHLYKK
jgi:hypothetical protein